MTNSLTIDIDSIGPILLEHSTRTKRTTITVEPNKGVRVAVPIRVPFDTALEFVNQNEHWIRKTLARIQQLESRKKDLAEVYSTIDKLKAKENSATHRSRKITRH